MQEPSEAELDLLARGRPGKECKCKVCFCEQRAFKGACLYCRHGLHAARRRLRMADEGPAVAEVDEVDPAVALRELHGAVEGALTEVPVSVAAAMNRAAHAIGTSKHYYAEEGGSLCEECDKIEKASGPALCPCIQCRHARGEVPDAGVLAYADALPLSQTELHDAAREDEGEVREHEQE